MPVFSITGHAQQLLLHIPMFQFCQDHILASIWFTHMNLYGILYFYAVYQNFERLGISLFCALIEVLKTYKFNHCGDMLHTIPQNLHILHHTDTIYFVLLECHPRRFLQLLLRPAPIPYEQCSELFAFMCS
jgi:hypothetical protein